MSYSKKKSHKDVDYEVYDSTDSRVSFPPSKKGGDRRMATKSPDEALVFAAITAISSGASRLDVIVWSRAGAKFVGGDDAVEKYKEDPDRSVFDRFEFKGNNVGGIA